MLILPSAYKHGESEADIRHAIAFYLWAIDQKDGMRVFVGPRRHDPALIEVGQIVLGDETAAIIHAMPARPKYLRAMGR